MPMGIGLWMGVSNCGGPSGVPLPTGPLLGANMGNIGLTEVTAYETWLGKNLDMVNLFAGRDTWVNVVGSIGFVAGLYAGVNRRRYWTLPLHLASTAGTDAGKIAENNSFLAQAAAGDFNSHYHDMAVAVLANAYPATGAIFVRMGHEFNLSPLQQPWSIWGGKHTDFIAAWRNFVNQFRAVSNRFKFVWCPNFEKYSDPALGYDGLLVDTELAYPGAAYVDVHGMDFYVNGFSADPTGAYNYYFGGNPTTGRRLNWHVAFAAANGRPWGIDEWGVNQDNFQTYISGAKTFFTANNAIYTMYWENTSAYNAMFSNGNYYFTGRQYRRDFGVSPAWTPAATLENSVTLVRWYSAADAASITTVSGLVSQWNDKSANAAHLTQATSGNRPPYNATSRNSKPALEFDGSTDVLASTDSTNIPGGQSAITLAFAAYGESDLATFRYFIQISGSAAIQVGAGSGQVPRWQTAAANYSGSGSLVSNDRIAVFTVPAGSSVTAKVQVDGNTETSTAGITRALNTMTGFQIGSGSAHVRVKDVLIFAGEMTTDDKDRLAGYLAWTYSTVANLPVGHPWKSTAPTL